MGAGRRAVALPGEAVDDPLSPSAAVPRAARDGLPHVVANMVGNMVGGLDGSATVSGDEVHALSMSRLLAPSAVTRAFRRERPTG